MHNATQDATQTSTALRAEAAKYRKKAKWHIDRAGSGGNWRRADEYTAKAEQLEQQAVFALDREKTQDQVDRVKQAHDSGAPYETRMTVPECQEAAKAARLRGNEETAEEWDRLARERAEAEQDQSDPAYAAHWEELVRQHTTGEIPQDGCPVCEADAPDTSELSSPAGNASHAPEPSQYGPHGAEPAGFEEAVEQGMAEATAEPIDPEGALGKALIRDYATFVEHRRETTPGAIRVPTDLDAYTDQSSVYFAKTGKAGIARIRELLAGYEEKTRLAQFKAKGAERIGTFLFEDEKERNRIAAEQEAEITALEAEPIYGNHASDSGSLNRAHDIIMGDYPMTIKIRAIQRIDKTMGCTKDPSDEAAVLAYIKECSEEDEYIAQITAPTDKEIEATLANKQAIVDDLRAQLSGPPFRVGELVRHKTTRIEQTVLDVSDDDSKVGQIDVDGE